MLTAHRRLLSPIHFVGQKMQVSFLSETLENEAKLLPAVDAVEPPPPPQPDVDTETTFMYG